MDFNQLEKELFGVMQKDDEYWRENDAKFRAAKQMATYEEFENIVKVISICLFSLRLLEISLLYNLHLLFLKSISFFFVLGISFETP